MITIMATASLSKQVTPEEVENNAMVVTGLIDYLRWLADQNTGLTLTTGQVWSLFYENMRDGRMLSEVCEDIGLPVREEGSE